MFENLTMYQAFLKAKEKTPNYTAIYFEGNCISYTDFDKLICKTAAFLQNNIGIGINDVVLICQPNIPQSLILLYAVNKLGAIANMVHPATPYNQLISIYEKTNSKVAFVFELTVAKEIEKYRKFPYPLIVTLTEDFLPLRKKRFYHYFISRSTRSTLRKTKDFKGFDYAYEIRAKENETPTVNNDPNRTAVLLHSGSTSGEPKTVCLSNDCFNSTAELACEILCMKEEDVKGKGMLSILPNFHGFGLCMSMHSPIVNSFAAVLVPRFKVKYVAKALRGFKNVISICGVPKIYNEIVKSPSFWNSKYIKRLQVCFCGGDSLSPMVLKQFNAKMESKNYNCRLFEGYGLSESTSVITVSTFDHINYSSVGYPLRGVDIKIVNDDGIVLKNKEIGEITIKSPSNMLGYYDNSVYNNECIINGYLYTGDLGYVDEEGFLYFVSRKKRVVKVSGVATFPNEVEKLIRSVPGVKDVCVVGVEDDEMTMALKAYVVSDILDKEDLRQKIFVTCEKYLIKWSVPKHIEFIDKIPKTLLQKNDYLKLQKR